MPDQAFIDFNGLGGIRGMSFTLSRGVTPSICTLYVVPQGDLDPGVGTLTWGYGSSQMQLTGCAMASSNLRQHWDQKWPLMAVQIQDRRWKWGGSISGTYNDHLQGTGALVSAKDLMFLCLLEMGETTADVSGAPTGVYPYVNWSATNPKLALADLCERCACEVVLNPLNDRVEIWQLGVGRNAPTGLGDTHPKWRFALQRPYSVEVQGGPSFFQYRLALEAVGRGTNLVQSIYPDWLTSLHITDESWNFPDVASVLGRELALETGWRYYRVKGQANGGLNVPGLNFAITSTSQYKLKDFILYQAYDDRMGKYQLINWYVEGDFFPFSDVPSNTSNQVYLGKATLYPERNLVHFDRPVFWLDTSGAILDPALYLQVGYNVTTTQGQLIGLEWTSLVGGSGGKLVLKRPECFAAYTPTYNTESIIYQELSNYASLFAQKYSNPWACEMEYGGVIVGTLDGNIAQARWEIHPSKGVRTTVYENFEGDVHALGPKTRRDRERTQQLWDEGHGGPF
jgi:hypothetical protein